MLRAAADRSRSMEKNVRHGALRWPDRAHDRRSAISPRISPYPPHISPHLPTSPHISPDLPRSPQTSRRLSLSLTSRRPVCGQAVGGARAVAAALARRPLRPAGGEAGRRRGGLARRRDSLVSVGRDSDRGSLCVGRAAGRRARAAAAVRAATRLPRVRARPCPGHVHDMSETCPQAASSTSRTSASQRRTRSSSHSSRRTRRRCRRRRNGRGGAPRRSLLAGRWQAGRRCRSRCRSRDDGGRRLNGAMAGGHAGSAHCSCSKPIR